MESLKRSACGGHTEHRVRVLYATNAAGQTGREEAGTGGMACRGSFT